MERHRGSDAVTRPAALGMMAAMSSGRVRRDIAGNAPLLLPLVLLAGACITGKDPRSSHKPTIDLGFRVARSL